MAKGVEDCAFYRTSRLTSLNEVGGDPSVFAIAPAEFHEAMIHRQAEWPAAMTTATTHDTKRGEDCSRAGSPCSPSCLTDWASWLERLLELAPVPEASFGNLLWQAVIGAWPASRERLHAYAEKAMREAGDRTAWTSVDVGYESAVHAAVDAAYDNPAVRGVLDEIMAAVVDAGWSNSLSAKLIGITMPGVPDVYQGAELWEQSLVDPDNRRPVDYDARRDLLASLGSDAARRPYGRRPRRREAPAHPPCAHGAARRPGAVHGIRTRCGTRRSCRARACLRPRRRRRHGRDPAAHWARGTGRAGATLDSTCRPAVAPRGVGRRGRHRRRRSSPSSPSPCFSTSLSSPVHEGDSMFGAPIPQRVTLVVGDRELPMRRGSGHWWTPSRPVDVPAGGVDYGYRLDDDPMVLPDPRSRCQPSGVHALEPDVGADSVRLDRPRLACTAIGWVDHLRRVAHRAPLRQARWTRRLTDSITSLTLGSTSSS